MASTGWVALSDEVMHILLRWWERQVLAEDRLNVLCVDDSSVTLVEELEALKSLSISAGFLESLEPMVCDDMLDEGEIDRVAVAKLWVRSLKFVLNVTRGHLVEAEVLENVSEEGIRNDSWVVCFLVVFEAFFKIVHDVSWES